jgi:hypothetical protein
LTFKDLNKRVGINQSLNQTNLFDRLQNRPFWIWDIKEHKQEDNGKTFREKTMLSSFFGLAVIECD